MDKQKQIEELAKDIGIAFQLAGTTRFGAVAEILVDKWQRKIPENAVVLTKEEYEKLLDVRTDVILKDIDKVFKEEFEDTKRSVERKIKPIYKAIETRTRKETAKEIFVEQKKFICSKWKQYMTENELIEFAKERYGVEEMTK